MLKFESGQFYFIFLLSLFHSENHVCFSRGVQVVGADACSDEDCGRSRRPAADDRAWSHRSDTRWLGDREVSWHRVRSVLATWRLGAWVSWLSLKTNIDGL
jgi:hypothetical protein